jgi:hypothetical protein
MAMHYEHWRRGVRANAAADEDTFATLVLHMNREIIHHGAQIELLRDLYRTGRRAHATATP